MRIYRNILMSSKNPSSKMPDGYVQDGCILCFDGYTPPDNGIWTDLSGTGNDLTLGSGVTYDSTNHCIIFSSNASQVKKEIVVPAVHSFEILYKAENGQWVFLNRNSNTTNYCPRLYHDSKTYLSTFASLEYTVTHEDGLDCNFQKLMNMPLIEYGDTGDYTPTTPNDYAYWQYKMIPLSNNLCTDTQWCRVGIAALNSSNILKWNPGDKYASNVYKQNPSFNPLSFEDSGVKLWAMRIYNRELTWDELDQNRALDFQRFNITCSGKSYS